MKNQLPFSALQDLELVKQWLYEPCGLELTDLEWQIESQEYGACSFCLGGRAIQYRSSKITPTKTGQFVAIWKRNEEGMTRPFEASEVDFFIIAARKGDQLGQFIFPKEMLAQKGIVSTQQKEGKRGMRVYPPWDVTANKQAKETQAWQIKYFVQIKESSPSDLETVKRYFC